MRYILTSKIIVTLVLEGSRQSKQSRPLSIAYDKQRDPNLKSLNDWMMNYKLSESLLRNIEMKHELDTIISWKLLSAVQNSGLEADQEHTFHLGVSADY